MKPRRGGCTGATSLSAVEACQCAPVCVRCWGPVAINALRLGRLLLPLQQALMRGWWTIAPAMPVFEMALPWEFWRSHSSDEGELDHNVICAKARSTEEDEVRGDGVKGVQK
ncbi:hypothetical protein GW17_00053995 [Ensete ventricosum]|nr:hypothetical protein GW17_00053995 [Ensete ventricosum]